MGKCISKTKDEMPEILEILKTLWKFFVFYNPKVKYMDIPDEIDIDLAKLEVDDKYKDLMSYMSYLYFTSELINMKVRLNPDGTQTYYYKKSKKNNI